MINTTISIFLIFKLLWPAIRDTFKEKLEDDFTPDIARAWTHVFDYLKARFQEGIRRGRNQKNEMWTLLSAVYNCHYHSYYDNHEILRDRLQRA